MDLGRHDASGNKVSLTLVRVPQVITRLVFVQRLQALYCGLPTDW